MTSILPDNIGRERLVGIDANRPQLAESNIADLSDGAGVPSIPLPSPSAFGGRLMRERSPTRGRTTICSDAAFMLRRMQLETARKSMQKRHAFAARGPWQRWPTH
jgi:hypothetical protein